MPYPEMEGVKKLRLTQRVVVESLLKRRILLERLKFVGLVKVDRILPLHSPAYDTDLSEGEIRNRWIQYWNEMNSKK